MDSAETVLTSQLALTQIFSKTLWSIATQVWLE